MFWIEGKKLPKVRKSPVQQAESVSKTIKLFMDKLKLIVQLRYFLLKKKYSEFEAYANTHK